MSTTKDLLLYYIECKFVTNVYMNIAKELLLCYTKC
jgi:hypothetical protein